ncbi:YjfB family protein [Undibacterium sp. RuRC25W]|uniref:YjfB family protein n=1 Tax=Undibacterium sp. RuRC25W TaxID=3413047 RepID=UPI003BF09F83
MSVTGIAEVATTLAQVGTSQAVNIAVLKKANELQTENATALIAAIPTTAPTANAPTSNLPPHLGRHVDVVA